MALINQNSLFDRLQKYIDAKTENLPKEIQDILDESGISEIIPHIDVITIVADDIDAVRRVGNNISYVINVGAKLDEVETVANNIDSVAHYADTYYGPMDTEPTTRPDGNPIQFGDMYFNTLTGNEAMMVYSNTNGGRWIEAGSPFDAVDNSIEDIAAAGQDTFNVEYDVGNVEVYIDGVRYAYDSYTATDGLTVVLNTPLTGGEVVYIQSFGTFDSANFYTKLVQHTLFANKRGSKLFQFEAADATTEDSVVNVRTLERDFLSNFSLKTHQHDAVYYKQTQFVNEVDPVGGFPNAPVKTSSITGKIDSTMLDIGGFTLQGGHTPTGAADEYPDTTTKDFGAFWVIDGLGDGVTYEYASGSLAGQIVEDNNLILYGQESWLISATELSPEAYVKRDGSNSMTGDLSFGGIKAPIHLADQNDATPDHAAMQIGYFKSKIELYLPLSGTVSGMDITGYMLVSTALASFQRDHLIPRRYVDDNFSPNDHNHNDFNEIIDTDGTYLSDALDAKVNNVDFDSHLNADNPHNVSATDVGAPSGSWDYDSTTNTLTLTVN